MIREPLNLAQKTSPSQSSASKITVILAGFSQNGKNISNGKKRVFGVIFFASSNAGLGYDQDSGRGFKAPNTRRNRTHLAETTRVKMHARGVKFGIFKQKKSSGDRGSVLFLKS